MTGQTGCILQASTALLNTLHSHVLVRTPEASTLSSMHVPPPIGVTHADQGKVKDKDWGSCTALDH